jgi:PAS domain-containing protein
MSFVGIDDHDGVVFVTLARPPANALACGTLAWAHPTRGGSSARRARRRVQYRDAVASSAGAPKSLPLILARELGANLATPMFLIDAEGMLVFYNEAAELLIGRSFAELGEIPSLEFGETLQLAAADGTPLRRRDTPAGVAFFERRPSHQVVDITTYDGARRTVEATAYPLFGAAQDLHGVLTVFWEVGATKENL